MELKSADSEADAFTRNRLLVEFFQCDGLKLVIFDSQLFGLLVCAALLKRQKTDIRAPYGSVTTF